MFNKCLAWIYYSASCILLKIIKIDVVAIFKSLVIVFVSDVSDVSDAFHYIKIVRW